MQKEAALLSFISPCKFIIYMFTLNSKALNLHFNAKFSWSDMLKVLISSKWHFLTADKTNKIKWSSVVNIVCNTSKRYWKFFIFFFQVENKMRKRAAITRSPRDVTQLVLAYWKKCFFCFTLGVKPYLNNKTVVSKSGSLRLLLHVPPFCRRNAR